MVTKYFKCWGPVALLLYKPLLEQRDFASVCILALALEEYNRGLEVSDVPLPDMEPQWRSYMLSLTHERQSHDYL